MKTLFILVLVTNIVLGFITIKYTEDERDSSFVGPLTPFFLLAIYKRSKKKKYIILFYLDIIFILAFIILLPGFLTSISE